MKALVLGGAKCLHADLKALGAWDGIVIGTNDAAAQYPYRVDHFATLHPEKLPKWTEERAKIGGNLDFVTWTHSHKMALADRWIAGWTNGSSGMLAVGVAFELGCDTVVLAGVPIESQPHFWDNTPWVSCETHWPHWVEREEAMRGRVFSMSGRTRELLGPPPWLVTELEAA